MCTNYFVWILALLNQNYMCHHNIAHVLIASCKLSPFLTYLILSRLVPITEPRRNSLACVADASLQRAASHNSFFDLTSPHVPKELGDKISAITPRNGEHHGETDTDEEIFVDARETLDEPHHSGSSPQWIDQSSSSLDTLASPRPNPGSLSPRDISMVIGSRPDKHRRDSEHLSARTVMEETQQEVERLNSPTRGGHVAVGHSVSVGVARSQPIGHVAVAHSVSSGVARSQPIMAPRREVKSTPPLDTSPLSVSPMDDVEMMEVSHKLSPRYRRKDPTGPESPNSRRGSVFDKISRVVSMKTKTKHKRTSSTDGESPTTQSKGVQSFPENDELSSGFSRVIVSGQDKSVPHLYDEEHTVVHMRVRNVHSSPSRCVADTQDANVQTLADDFTMSNFEENANEYALLGNLDDALLGSTHNRPRSNSRPRSMGGTRVSHVSSTDSDPFRDSSVGSDTRYSLDNVILEYDHIMEKYSSRADDPDFDTNTDGTGSCTSRTASGSVSSCQSDSTSAGGVNDGFQPIPDLVSQLNTNCNHYASRVKKEGKRSVHFALNTNDRGPKDDDDDDDMESLSFPKSIAEGRNLLPPGAISKPHSLAFPNDERQCHNDDSCPSGGSEDLESEAIFARFSKEMAAVGEASKASPEIDRLTPDNLGDEDDSDDRTAEIMNSEFVSSQDDSKDDDNNFVGQISIGVGGGRYDSSETNNSESVSSSTNNGVCDDISVLAEDQMETEQLAVSPTGSLISQSPSSNGGGAVGSIGVMDDTLGSPDRISVSADPSVDITDSMSDVNEGACAGQQDGGESDMMCYGASAKGCCSLMHHDEDMQEEDAMSPDDGSDSQQHAGNLLIESPSSDYSESQRAEGLRLQGYIELRSDCNDESPLLENNESADFDESDGDELCAESQESHCSGTQEPLGDTPSLDSPLIETRLIDSPAGDSLSETVGPIPSEAQEHGTTMENLAAMDTVILEDESMHIEDDSGASSNELVEL